MSRRSFSAIRRIWLLPFLLVAACGGGGVAPSSSKQITLYTCVNGSTVKPVISRFESAHPGTQVHLYRAATGNLNARVAADVRSGGLRADVVWACDPLTMQRYSAQGLLAKWTPADASALPRVFRTSSYVGAAVLYMVAVYHTGVPAPQNWSDLTSAPSGKVAVPDPSFAASALGALGYFSRAPGYGLNFYKSLKTSGAVQVSSPDNVTTGVAQGIYGTGMTTANSAYAAHKAGSPVGVAWPKPGAIAIYGPIALAKRSANATLARDFIAFVISKPGQETLVQAGSYPTLPGIGSPTVPAGAPVVFPDWSAIAADQGKLLSGYDRAFGS